MLESLLQRMGGARRLELSNPNVWCFLREDDGHAFLFLANLTTSTLTTEVRLRGGMNQDWQNLDPCTLPPMTVHCVNIIGDEGKGGEG